MFALAILADSRRTSAFAIFVLTLALSFCSLASAQDQVNSPSDIGNGGRNTIQGSIFLPGGARLNQHARVTLKSLGFGEQFALSDDNGAFIFRWLRGGTYFVSVDAGKEFEVVQETVDVIDPARRTSNQVGVTYTMNVNLQPKNAEATRPGTVSATAPKIPDEAVKSYGKAQQLSKDGKTDEAIAELKKALQTCPTFGAAFNELGLDYLKKRQIGDAEEAFK
ncbi:MAG: hypothetical protein ACREDR_13690, partial [Blastocatellia bacterium]